jgi:hypothetical protein
MVGRERALMEEELVFNLLAMEALKSQRQGSLTQSQGLSLLS